MSHKLVFIFLFILMTTAFASSDSSSKVTVSEGKIFVDGKPFFVKGMCYSPSYPGQGGGALVFKFLPEKIREKDFQMMKEAGVNTLRIYEPMFDEFYETAGKYGFRIIEPVLSPGSGTNVKSEKSLEEYKKTAIDHVRKMKKNPCILMWSLWNDAPFEPSIVKKFGIGKVNDFFFEIYKAVRKEDPDHPVTGANMSSREGFELGVEFLDVIGFNDYLGLDYSNQAWTQGLFSMPHARQALEKLLLLQKRSGKPVLITEIGVPTVKRSVKQGLALSRQLGLARHLAGVCVFEWTDEWWKSGDRRTRDPNVEDNWGILDGYRNPKPGYAAVKEAFGKS